MPEFRYVGNSAAEAVVGETRPMLAPGDFITLEGDDLENEQNKALNLMPVEPDPDDDTPSNADAEGEQASETTAPQAEATSENKAASGSEGGETT